VYHAIEAFVPIIAAAPQTRRHESVGSIGSGLPTKPTRSLHRDARRPLGELCASKEIASRWADELVGITRMALSPDPKLHGHFHGSSACLSALYTAERYEELVDILPTRHHLAI